MYVYRTASIAYLCHIEAASLDAHMRHVCPDGGALYQAHRGVRLVHVPHRQVQREVYQRCGRFVVNLQ